MRRSLALLAILALAACGETGSYKTPTLSNSNASGMSDATLCYRYAAAARSSAIDAEVAARRLDCSEILEGDPLYQ